MNRARILITGGSGFIGRNLAEQLAGSYQVYAPRHQELDLLDSDAVLAFLEEHRFDAVLHSATPNASRNPKGDISKVLPNSLRMFFNLVRGSAHFGQLLYFGSGAEYDMRHYQPLMPEEAFGLHIPADDYGFAKYVMQRTAERAARIVNLRVFGVFGKYEDWEIRFISNACCKALFGLPITLRQNVRFDYLWIDDLVRLTRHFLENPADRPDYNVCTSDVVDLVSLAEKVREVSGKSIDIKVAIPGFKRAYSGNNQKLMARQKGGFAFTPQDEAIQTLYRWYEANRSLIDPDKLRVDK